MKFNLDEFQNVDKSKLIKMVSAICSTLPLCLFWYFIIFQSIYKSLMMYALIKDGDPVIGLSMIGFLFASFILILQGANTLQNVFYKIIIKSVSKRGSTQ